MPKIRPIEATQNAPGPVQGRRATAEDFGSAVWEGAARLGQAGFDTGVYLQRQANQTAISDARAKVSQYQSQQAIMMEEGLKKAPIGDDKFSDKFMEQFSNSSTEFEGQFENEAAKQYVKQALGSMKGHFLEASYRGQAQLMGEKARIDNEATINSGANAILADPDLYDVTASNDEIARNALVDQGNMPRAMAMKLQEMANRTYAEAKVEGTMRKDTRAAKALLDSGKLDEHIPNKEKLYEQIRRQESFNRTEAEYREREAEKQRRKKADTVMNDYTSKLLNGETVDIKKIAAEKDLSDDDKWNMHNRIVSVMRSGNISDPNIFNQLYAEINNPPPGAPPFDEKRLFEAVSNKQLAAEGKMSAKTLLGYLHGKKTQAGIERSQAERAMEKFAQQTFNSKDPDGAAKLAEWTLKKIETQQLLREKQLPESLMWQDTGEYSMKQFIVAPSAVEIVEAELRKNGVASTGMGRDKKFFEVQGPKPGAAPVGTVMTPQMQKYNDILEEVGGSPDQAFGPNGERPISLNLAAASRADKLVKEEAEEQNRQFKVSQQLALAEEKDAERKRETIRSRNERFEKEQKAAQAALGLQPPPPAEDENARKPGESTTDYLKRMGKL